jgi:spore coat protein U-like protein
MFSRARIVTLVLLAAGMMVLGAGAAQAQTATASFNVTANAVSRCTIAAAALDFGTYDPTNVNPTNGFSDLSVRCTRGTNAWIGLDLGSNAAGAVRQMANGAARLQYELYRDAGRTQVWTNLIGGGYAYAAGSNALTAVRVYGQIGALQDVAAVAFTDTVVATVNF